MTKWFTLRSLLLVAPLVGLTAGAQLFTHRPTTKGQTVTQVTAQGTTVADAQRVSPRDIDTSLSQVFQQEVRVDLTDSAGVQVASAVREIRLYRNGQYHSTITGIDSSRSLNLEPGTYDGLCIFTTGTPLRVKRQVGTVAYDIIEGFKIQKGATKKVPMLFSMKHCTHRIGVKPVMYDGTVCHSGTLDPKSRYWTNDKRNYWSSGWWAALRNDEANNYYRDLGSGFGMRKADADSAIINYEDPAILVSDASDKFSFTVGAVVLPLEDRKRPEAIGFATSGFSGDIVLENDPADFVEFSTKIRSSVIGSKSTYSEYGANAHFGSFGVGVGQIIDPDMDSLGIVTRSILAMEAFEHYKQKDSNPFNTALNNLDYYGPKTSNATSNAWNMQSMPKMIFKDGKLATWILHPQVNYLAEQIGAIPGNNVPVTSHLFDGYAGYNNTNSFYYPSIKTVGRYGEECETSMGYSMGQLRAGKTLLYSGDAATAVSKIASLLSKNVKDTVTLKVTNKQFKVDDLQGQNTTTLTMVMSSRADFNAPSLNMLQLRDKATGKVTDRFAQNSANDQLLLVAGDFDFVNASGVYVHEPTVQLSWAPHGSTQWTALPVTVVAGSYDFDNGYVYQGNLEGVKTKSPSKWYDLRVELSDQRGNKDVQVIAPAFRIDSISASGVTEVLTTKAVQSVRYYNLQGQPSGQPFQGVNIQVTQFTDGTTTSKKIIK